MFRAELSLPAARNAEAWHLEAALAGALPPLDETDHPLSGVSSASGRFATFHAASGKLGATRMGARSLGWAGFPLGSVFPAEHYLPAEFQRYVRLIEAAVMGAVFGGYIHHALGRVHGAKLSVAALFHPEVGLLQAFAARARPSSSDRDCLIPDALPANLPRTGHHPDVWWLGEARDSARRHSDTGRALRGVPRTDCALATLDAVLWCARAARANALHRPHGVGDADHALLGMLAAVLPLAARRTEVGCLGAALTGALRLLLHAHHPLRCVLSAKLALAGALHAVRGMLATALAAALDAEVHHPVLRVLGAELSRPSALHTEARFLGAAVAGTLLPPELYHSALGVLGAKLPFSAAPQAVGGVPGAASTHALLAAHPCPLSSLRRVR